MRNEHKDLSKIIKIIETNGVGFVKCFFRVFDGTFPPQKTGIVEVDCTLFFSDGKDLLGTLELRGVTTSEFSGPKYGHNISRIPKEKSLNFPIVVTLFWYSAHTCGECIIRNLNTYESEQEGEEKTE